MRHFASFRVWFARNWQILVPAAVFAALAAAYVGPIVGLLVYAICASVDLALSTAIAIGMVITFAITSYGCWLALDWARGRLHSYARRTT